MSLSNPTVVSLSNRPRPGWLLPFRITYLVLCIYCHHRKICYNLDQKAVPEMVRLGNEIIFVISIHFILFFLCLLALYLALRLIAKKMNILPFIFKGSRLKHLSILFSLQLLIFLFVSRSFTRNGKNELDMVVSRLQKCPCLQVTNYYVNLTSGKEVIEDITVVDRETIRQLSQMLTTANYSLFYEGGIPKTVERLYVTCPENNSPADLLTLYCTEETEMHLGKGIIFNRDLYVYKSHNLLNKVRDLLKLGKTEYNY